ncbi:MAG: trigger factor [Chloroflexi bacterium]|nr:trigger factor [Chloroflexota bacterium]
MKVTNDKTENSQAFLTVEMEPAEMEEGLQEAYHHLVKRTNVPGFRKGKAPRAILERYIGRESLLEDALHHIIPEACDRVIAEQKLEAVGQPQVEITQTEPVTFKLMVPLAPKVRLGEYLQVRVEETPAVLNDEDVDKVIEQLRHQHAVWEPVERPASYGDLAAIDIESRVGEEPFIKQDGVQYYVRQGSAVPIQGFAEQVVDMKIGETKEFTLTVPLDHAQAVFAGKEALFTVKVAEIKQEKLPELNDDFAKQVGAEFQTVAALRERVQADLKSRAEEKAKEDLQNKAVEALVNISEMEFPPVMVEREIDRLISQQLRFWRMDDRGLGEYLRSINKTETELREELRPVATKRVKQALAIDELAKTERIEATDSEIDAEIDRLVKATAEKEQARFRKELSTPVSRESLKQDLVIRKALERLVAIAKGPTVTANEETQKEVSS